MPANTETLHHNVVRMLAGAVLGQLEAERLYTETHPPPPEPVPVPTPHDDDDDEEPTP
jgi:hypothetical protein